MLQMNLTIVNKIHLKSETFFTGEKLKATVHSGESKFNDSPVWTGSSTRICVKMEFTYGGWLLVDVAQYFWTASGP